MLRFDLEGRANEGDPTKERLGYRSAGVRRYLISCRADAVQALAET